MRLNPWLLASAGGALQFLIHPDANAWLLAPLALAPLILLAQNKSLKERFFAGWLAGFLHWMGLCYWIQGTLERHGGVGLAGSLVLLVFFALAKGLHTAAFVSLAGFFAGSRWAVPLCAALWVGIERLHAPFGFTWLLLGNAALDWPSLPCLAPWTGVYGLSFLFAGTGAAVALRKPRWLTLALVPLVLPPMPDSAAATRRALAVQPNYHEEEPPLEPERDLVAWSAPATRERFDLVVWPEMPAGLYYDLNPALRQQFGDLARAAHAPLLFGSVARANTREPLNSAVLIDAFGEPRVRYDKSNLVPFGEFVPWPFDLVVDKVSDQAGMFAPGAGSVVFSLNGHRAGAFICYESAFPHYVREFAASGAELLINLTNDGYFARSAARAQHLRLARLRAIENRRWLLRPTNDGFTVSIDPAGRLHDPLPPFVRTQGPLRFEYSGETTFYTRHGDWFAWACLGTSLAALVTLTRNAKRSSDPPGSPAAPDPNTPSSLPPTTPPSIPPATPHRTR